MAYVLVDVVRGQIVAVRLYAHAFQAAEEARELIESPRYDERRDRVQVFRMSYGIGEPLMSDEDVKAIRQQRVASG